MIDSYLTGKTETDDAAVHLLFSANRWEKRYSFQVPLKVQTSWQEPSLEADLGTTCDRECLTCLLLHTLHHRKPHDILCLYAGMP